LVGIRLDRWKPRIGVSSARLRLWQIKVGQFRRAPNDFVQVHRFAMDRLFAGE
jgi:hypothetical protein